MSVLEVDSQELTGAARFVSEFEAFQRELPAGEPGSVRALRRMAIERFATVGFPTLRQEEWRQMNVAPITKTAFQLPAAGTEPSVQLGPLEPVTAGAAARLVFVNGRLSTRLSFLERSPAGGGGREPRGRPGPRSGRRSGADPALARPVRKDRSEPLRGAQHRLPARWRRSVVPQGVVLERPIHVVFLSAPVPAPVPGNPVVTFPRNLFLFGESSQASIVETYAGEGAYFTCPVTELVAGPAAVVDHYKLQRESPEAFHVATFHVQGERGSVPSSHSISIGGGLVRNDVVAVLDGEGIDCILNGLYLAEGRQVIDNHMRVEHAKPHCASHELYKGILDGKARAVFNGLIHVHPGAQKTDAKQSNRNLLLSADAIANSNPQLEIFADDVKCTHGSTVGQLDEDAVFYLRSRGIGEEAARSLLTYAFASDIVERIKVEPLRRDLEEFLFHRLPQGEVVRQAV